MAGRDINIPMGPDRTGKLSIPQIEVNAETPEDAAAAPASAASADLSGLDVAARPIDEGAAMRDSRVESGSPWSDIPTPDAFAEPASDIAPGSTATMEPITSSASASFASSAASQPALEDSASRIDASASGGLEDEYGNEFEDAPDESAEAEEKPVNDVAASLGALRDSIGQGRELRAREKDRAELAARIEEDRAELADRDDILANYAVLVAEQDDIIAQNTNQRDACKAQLAQVAAETDETNSALERMRDYHDVQLQPLQNALGRAQANADQAKNDARSRKSELNAAESEARRAENGNDANTARARLDVAKAAYDDAVARSNAAKDALAEAQKAFDDMSQQVEQAETPLENSLDDLARKTDELKEEITRLGDVISSASKRRQYCDSVYQYPAETEKLRDAVMSDEAHLAQLDAENDELRSLLAQSKAKSTKAKLFIAVVILIIVVLILAFWYVSSR